MNHLLILVLLFAASLSYGQDLYAIKEEGKWGYINTKGEPVIPPKYEVVGHFEDGLAPVRLNGKYGYIDSLGSVMIPFQYEFADDFKFGYARVLQFSDYYLINTDGNVILDLVFETVPSQLNNKSTLNISGKGENTKGVIDLERNLIVDTAWTDIEWVGNKNEFAIASRPTEHRYQRTKAVFDTKGKVIIPPDKFEYIKELGSIGWIATDTNRRSVLLNLNGSLLFDGADYGLLSNDRTPILAEDKIIVKVNEKDKYCVLNEKGNVLFVVEDCMTILPFKNGKTFVQKNDKLWYLFGSNGKYLTTSGYQSIVYGGWRPNALYMFHDGTELVELNNSWIRIDEEGKKVSCDGCEAIQDVEGRTGNFYKVKIDRRWDSCLDLNDEKIYPLSKLNTNITKRRVTRGLNAFAEDGIVGYKNAHQEVVWKTGIPDTIAKNFDVDHSFTWHFKAKSPYRKDTENLGGWGDSEQWFARMDSIGFQPQDSQFGVYVETDSICTTQDQTNSYSVFIYNNSSEEVTLSAMDSKLYLHIQVKNRNGSWVTVTNWYPSTCGNSYHSVFLPSGYCWEERTPIFEGDHETEARLMLSGIQKSGSPVYSNTFPVKVRPALLRNKAKHSHAILSYRLK
jgi:hypothetical protein